MIRYLLCILGIALFGIKGFDQVSHSYNAVEENKKLVAENEKLLQDLDTAKRDRDAVVNSVKEKGIIVASSNLEIAQNVSMLPASSVTSIDAEYKDGNDFVKIVSASNVPDVEFFGSEVQYMQFNLTSTDLTETLNSVMNLGLQIISLNIDYENMEIKFRVPAMYTNQGVGEVNE